MRPTPHDDDQARELALAYVLELLDRDPRASFEAHLSACSPCRSEVATLEPLRAVLVDALLERVPRPSSDLWERVLARIDRPAGDARQPWRRWSATDESFVPADSPWEETGIPGVQSRRLHLDARDERVTMLVRMAPGSSYPPHRHGGPETCFVVSGDLRIGSRLHMRAGDFEHVEEGSDHPVQSTDEGCVLLITCSLSDELH